MIDPGCQNPIHATNDQSSSYTSWPWAQIGWNSIPTSSRTMAFAFICALGIGRIHATDKLAAMLITPTVHRTLAWSVSL